MNTDKEADKGTKIDERSMEGRKLMARDGCKTGNFFPQKFPRQIPPSLSTQDKYCFAPFRSNIRTGFETRRERQLTRQVLPFVILKFYIHDLSPLSTTLFIICFCHCFILFFLKNYLRNPRLRSRSE